MRGGRRLSDPKNSGIPGINKLLELTASGIGANAGIFLATWKARKEGEARTIGAEADAKILQIRTEAHAKARELWVSGDSTAGGEIDLADLVSERITYQERKRQTNIRCVVAKAAAELEHKEVPIRPRFSAKLAGQYDLTTSRRTIDQRWQRPRIGPGFRGPGALESAPCRIRSCWLP